MAFTFQLVTVDGTPADPPSFKTVAPQWKRRRFLEGRAA
jgi:hypothetical protein